MGKGGSIADVHCPKCGAPAKYDIIRGSYQCGFCGSRVELSEAMAEKQGFREMQQEKIRSSSQRYQLMHAACSGCGAKAERPHRFCPVCGASMNGSRYRASWVDEAEGLSALLDDDW